MDYSSPIDLTKTWKTLEFSLPYLKCQIPSLLMREESLIMPPRNWSSAKAILINTRTELSSNLQKIIEGTGNHDSHEIWWKITKEIAPRYKDDPRYSHSK